MECPQNTGDGIDLVIAYTARTLDPETAIAFERHLDNCERCRQIAGAQQSVWSALDELPPVAVSSDFDEKLYQRIAREDELPWWRKIFGASWSWRPAMPLAAACAVLIVAFLVRDSATGPAQQTTPAPKVQIEQVEHALDDMDMLKQMGIEAVPETSGASERI